MKKIIILLLTVLLFASCSKEPAIDYSSSSQVISTDETALPDNVDISEPTNDISSSALQSSAASLSDIVKPKFQKYDLNLAENSEYLKQHPLADVYAAEGQPSNSEYSISGNRKIIEDKETRNLLLKAADGNMKTIIESKYNPDHEFYKWATVRFVKMIDENKFFYSIDGMEMQLGFGIYDLSSGADHRYKENEGGNFHKGWSLIKIAADRIFVGYTNPVFLLNIGEISLNNYQLTEIDIDSQKNEIGNIWHSFGISPDGNRAALIKGEAGTSNEYEILIYGIKENSVLQKHVFNFNDRPLYVAYPNEKQIYLFSNSSSNDKGYVYVIDL